MIGLSQEQRDTIISFLSGQIHAHTIILFGSAAKQQLRENSDIDIAFLSQTSYSPYEIFMKAQELADLLGRDVDLIDFRQASTVFKAQIVSHGKLLLDKQTL